MKEPQFFKSLDYPAPLALKPVSSQMVEWTEICESPFGAMSLHVPENTEQEFVFFQNLPKDAQAATLIQVKLERSARARLILIQEGAAVSHLEVHAVCAGEGAELEIRGLQNTREKQKHSVQVNVVHEKSHTRSDMKVWCVGQDQGHSVFNGLVDIKPGARHAEAYQRNKNLMLSSKATMDTFPKLFIAHDEVKAAHGASVSTIEPDQLAYLQSRGLSRSDAEQMVMQGFVHQVVEDMKDLQLRTQLERKLGLTEMAEESQAWGQGGSEGRA